MKKPSILHGEGAIWERIELFGKGTAERSNVNSFFEKGTAERSNVNSRG